VGQSETESMNGRRERGVMRNIYFLKELNVRLFLFRWLQRRFYFGFFPTWVLQVQWLFLVLLH